MKTSFSICVAMAIACACCNAHAELHNTLKPKGKPGEPVKIVSEGKPLGAIQLPERPTPQQKKAAGDLQYWIREITGATLDITSEKGGKCCIAIQGDSSLDDEGYSIAVSQDQIVLSGGKTRGPVNAVYALLEEDLGCRFYTNESIHLPKTSTLILSPVPRRYIPQLKIRDPFYKCAFDPVWSLRNRTNAPDAGVAAEDGGHMSYDGMFVHTAGQLVPVDKYFKEHPEYFALQPDGQRSPMQLCATHPDVAKIATEHVLKVLKEHPDAQILSVSKNDCQIMCYCERCKNLRDAEGSEMANQLCLVNQVAEAIENKHPGVAIDTLAYLDTIQVPKTARPRKNVVIRLCNDAAGSWVYPFTPAEKCSIAKLVSAWSAVHDRIYIWDYNVNFSHYLAPMPNLDVIAANIRFWMKNHAEGVMLQGGYQGPAENDELKSWVAAKLLWDPSRNEKELAEDFIRGHYGKAAEAMLEYEILLYRTKEKHEKEMMSLSHGIRYSMDSAFLSKDFLASATAVLARAKELAAGDEAVTRRVERAQLPILYVKCERGPEFVGTEYSQVVDAFERIAHRENVQKLQETSVSDFEKKLAEYKARKIQREMIPQIEK